MKDLENKATPLWVALAWIAVTVPMAWGVYQSVVKSRPLFGAPATSATGRAHDPR